MTLELDTLEQSLDAESDPLRERFLARVAEVRAQAELSDTVAGTSSVDAEPEPEPDDDLPTFIGRYPVLECLGAGGMGVVYGAYDDSLDRRLAIKVLHRRVGATHSRRHQRLQREAQAMALVTHPNLVTVHEVGTSKGQLFVVMEFVPGPTLERWLLLEPRTWREVTAVFCQIAAGLAALHEAGLVHRDVKPSNVIIGDDGRVRVLDLGLVGLDHSELVSTADNTQKSGSSVTGSIPLAHGLLTKTGDRLGTPAFMSPEQFRGERLTPASDMFSCCVALYEALYGVHPFIEDEYDTLENLRERVLQCKIPAPPQPNPVPGWLHALVLRGLQPDPAQRPASMAEFQVALATDPRETRRRRIRSAALASFAALAGVLISRPESIDHHAVCDDGQAIVERIWSPAHADLIRSAMVQTELGYAPALADRVVIAIDDYAQAWAASYDWTCHTRIASPGARVDARLACLDQRRTALSLSVNILAHADAGVVEHAGSMIAELPPIDACADYTPVTEPEPELALDPGTVERAARLDAQLTESSVLTHAGRTQEALRRALEVGEEATMHNLHELVVRALLAQARAQLAAHERQAKLAAPLVEALALSLEHGFDNYAAEAMTRLLYARGLDGRSAKTIEDAPIASALVARANAPELRALLHNNLGAVHLAAGQRAEARAAFEQALELSITEHGPGHLDLAAPLANLAILSVDPVKRAAYFGRLLTIFNDQLGPSHPRTLDARLLAALHAEDPSVSARALTELCASFSELGARSLSADCEFERGRRAYARAHLSVSAHAMRLAKAAMDPDDPRLELVEAYLDLSATPRAATREALEHTLANLDAALRAGQTQDWWLTAQHGELSLVLGLVLAASGERRAGLDRLAQAIDSFAALEQQAAAIDRDWLLALARSRHALLAAARRDADQDSIRSQASAARDYFSRWPDAYGLRLVELDAIAPP